MPSDSSTSDYFKKLGSSNSHLDLSYLFDIDDQDFRKFFSLETFIMSEQRGSRDYEKHYQYIYSGCSETTGEYLASPGDKDYPPYDSAQKYLWGKLVGDTLGQVSTLNLSTGGASVMGLVTNLTRQIRLYGPPEHLFLLLPPLDSRVTFVKDQSKLISISDNQELVNDITSIGEHEATYSKRPHAVEELLTKRWATYLNIQSLIMLEELCKSYQINLVYSTWSITAHETLTMANSLSIRSGHGVLFKNYIPSDYRKTNGNCVIAAEALPSSCHVDESSHPRWFIGKDNTHMGVHAHIHVADVFKKELQKRGLASNL